MRIKEVGLPFLLLSKVIQNLAIFEQAIRQKFITDYSLELPNGMTIYYPCEERAYVHCYYSSVWKHNVYGKVPELGNVMDVGASQGMFSLMASGIANWVIALEPEPNTFNMLRGNLEANDIKNVTPMEMALSDRTEKINLYTTAELFGSGFSLSPKRPRDKIEVYATTLDDLLETYFVVEDFDLVKMDIEGAEPLALKGAIKAMDNQVVERFAICVYHYQDEDREVKEILESYDYKTETVFFGNGDIILYGWLS